MPVPEHETAAKEIHPEAREFTPVFGIFGRLCGWTFEVHQKESAIYRYSWVTLGNTVSEDCVALRHDAARNLKAYARKPKKED